MSNKIEQLGWLERGNGKNQSNIVYSIKVVLPCLTASCGVKFWIYVIERSNTVCDERKQL